MKGIKFPQGNGFTNLQTPLFSEALYGNFYFPPNNHSVEESGRSSSSFQPPVFSPSIFEIPDSFQPHRSHKPILASFQFLLLRVVFLYLVNTTHI